VLADGDLLVMLAEALGVALPSVAEMEAKVRELVRTPPPAPSPSDVAPWAVSTPVAGRLRVIAEEAIFTGGGTLAFDPRVAELRARPRAALNPRTAAGLGLTDGDRVTLTAANDASLRDLPVVLDSCVPEDAVSLLGGIPAAPVNALGAAATVTVEKALVTA